MAKKKGCLGCSLPVAISIIVVVLAIIIVGVLAGPLGDAFGVKGLPSWMTLHSPEPKLPAEVIFHIAGFPVTNTIIATWITMAVLILLFGAAFSRSKLVPGRLQAMAEAIMQYIYDLSVSIAGAKNGRKYFPLIATIFLFVLFNAWLALVPGFGSLEFVSHEGELELIRGANTDLNTTLGLALVSFLVAEFVGFKTHKFSYLKKFFIFGGIIDGFKALFHGKIGKGMMDLVSGVIRFITGIIELLGEFIRIISLAFRLFGNMTAGEILLLSIAFLVPYFVPIVFYGLEILVGFIQALVFSCLTIVYISLSAASHEEESEHH